MKREPGPQVAHILEDRTVILEDGLKRYVVCVASWGSEIDCEYPMENSRSRRGIGSASICKRRVKRCTPLFAKLDAMARAAIIAKAADDDDTCLGRTARHIARVQAAGGTS